MTWREVKTTEGHKLKAKRREDGRWHLACSCAHWQEVTRGSDARTATAEWENHANSQIPNRRGMSLVKPVNRSGHVLLGTQRGFHYLLRCGCGEWESDTRSANKIDIVRLWESEHVNVVPPDLPAP